MTERKCNECEQAVPAGKRLARGLCHGCYLRGRKAGTLPPKQPRPVIPLADRIDSRIEIDAGTDCWLWSGSLNNAGYATTTARVGEGKPRTVLLHRLQYERHVGPIPDGLVIDHLCGVRRCLNPSHMEPVTYRENTMRSPIALAALNARKTHCPQGHEYTPENTYVNRGTGRLCRRCTADHSRRGYAARKQVSA